MRVILYLLFLILIVVWLVFLLVKALDKAKPRVLPEEVPLDSVRDALVEKQRWSVERAEAARVEYVRFLTLLQMKPGFMLVPWTNAEGQDDLDQFWHQHILDTAKYAADCHRLFGRIIHHNPHVVRGSGEETTAVEKTQRLYARTFASNTDGGPVDAVFLAGCGACAAPDAGHGGHGSGDAGHSDGGSHGCGGHGCGGHSCGGSGCGGH